MSQPDTELANLGEESIEDIAGAMGAGGDEDTDLPEDEIGDEGDDEGEEDQPDAGDDDPEEEWEAGGKQFKVKKSELRAGYMKDADYRQKTAEVAEQRRAVEQAAQQIQQERQNAASQLDVFLGALHKELLGSQPDTALLDTDPTEYLRQQAAYNHRAGQYQAALQQRQALQGRITEDQQRQRQEYMRTESAKLLESLPAWRDEKVRSTETAQVAKYLSDLGYSAQELNELVDHRALLVARDAALYRAMQSAKDKKAQPAPPRPVRPGAAGNANPNARLQRAGDRLKRDPNDLDALSAFVGASDA